MRVDVDGRRPGVNESQPGSMTETGDALASFDAWRLCRTAFDPARAAFDESLFALANGSLGVRGGFEECPGDGCFLAAAYAQSPIHYHERLAGFARSTDTRVPVAEGKEIAVYLGEERLDIFDAEWLAFTRTPDLRAGSLHRRLRLRTARGATLEIEAERVVPLGMADILAIRFTLRSIDYAGPLTLVSALRSAGTAQAQGDDPRIGAGSGGRLHCEATQVGDDIAWLHESGRDGDLHVFAAQRHLAGQGLRDDGVERDDDRVAQRFAIDCVPGTAATLEKFVAYVSGPDVEGLHARADVAVTAAYNQGFDRLAALQADAMSAFWRDAGLSVPGDPRVEQALRFNLFHLFLSAGRNGVDGTAAKGLTGEGYEGHCFWDTEAFVLPVMAFVAPEVARAMLAFRHRTLDAARAHARELNYPRGALYPWRTIAGGECSAHYPSGSAAYHINAAVAYAIGLYLDATDDLAFIVEAGAEMLFETARIWPQAGHFDPRRGGAFCIHGVTGPDEYTRWSTTTTTRTGWRSGICSARSRCGSGCAAMRRRRWRRSPHGWTWTRTRSRCGRASPRRHIRATTRMRACSPRTTVSSVNRAGRFRRNPAGIARCCWITTRSPSTAIRSANRPMW